MIPFNIYERKDMCQDGCHFQTGLIDFKFKTDSLIQPSNQDTRVLTLYSMSSKRMTSPKTKQN